MPTLTEGDLSTIGFFLTLAIIAAITWFACPDKYPETTGNFDPHVWCPLDCMGDEGQTEPCDDCPYVGPPVPRHMGRSEGFVPDRLELPTVGEYARVRIPESWGKQPPCCGNSHAYCEDPCDSGCMWESICLALIEEET